MLDPGVAGCDVWWNAMTENIICSAALGKSALGIGEGLSMDVTFESNKAIGVIQVLAIIEFLFQNKSLL